MNTEHRNKWMFDFFKGEDVFIVGGGTSLVDFDFEKLKGKNVICVNYSFLFVPYCQIVVFLDAQFGEYLRREKIDIYKQEKIFITGPFSRVTIKENVFKVEMAKQYTPGSCLHFYGRSNSTLIAINCSLVAGAKNIYLLGIDQRYTADGDHFYNSKRDIHGDISHKEGRYRRVIKDFEQYQQFENIINLSSISLIPYFRKEDVNNIL